MSKKHNTKEDTISAHEELNVAWDRHEKQMTTHTAIRHPDTHDLTAQSAHGRKVPALLEWVRDASDRNICTGESRMSMNLLETWG